MAEQYEVVVTRYAFRVDEENTGFKSRGETVAIGDGDDEIDEKQAKRGVELGALRPLGDDGPQGPLVTEDPEYVFAEVDDRLPTGQSDPASLLQVPAPDPGPVVLDAAQLSSMTVAQVVGFAATHPSQRESILQLEQQGRNREGIAKLLADPVEPEEPVPAEAVAPESDPTVALETAGEPPKEPVVETSRRTTRAKS